MNRRQKYLFVFIFSIILVVLNVTSTFAHRGRTDFRGGHKDNQNRSGLGSYHYHCDGYSPHLHKNGVCPYDDSVEVSSFESTAKTYSNPLKIYGVPEKVYAGDTFWLDTNSEDIESWESSNESVAQVDSLGYVITFEVGTATITAKAYDGTKKSIKIRTQEIVADLVEIESDVTALELGQSFKLKASISPYNTTNKSLEWKSNNEEVLEINSLGYIKAVGIGKTTIMVTTSNGKTSSMELEVTPIYAKSISISYDQKVISENGLDINDTLDLRVKVLPYNTEDKSYKWNISDSSILKIENDVVIPLKTGSTIITVSTSNGIEDSIKINVTRDYMYHLLLGVMEVSIIFVGIRFIFR